MMKFCQNCGAQLAEGTKFCTECGFRLPAAPVEQPASVSKPAPQPVPQAPVQQPRQPVEQPPVQLPRQPVEQPPVQQPRQPAEQPPVQQPWQPVYQAPVQQPPKTGKKSGGKSGLIIGVVAAVVALVVGLLVFLGRDKGPDPNAIAAGTYELIRIDSADASEAVNAEDLAMLKSLGMMSTLELKEDGTGSMNLMGEEVEPLKWTQDSAKFNDGTSATLKKEGGQLLLSAEGVTFVFAPASATTPVLPTTPTETEPQASLYDWWEGEWYGWWVVWSGNGDYAELEDDGWDAYARIDVDGDEGSVVLWDVDCSASDPLMECEVSFSSGLTEHGTMRVESGWFDDMPLAHADWSCDPGSSTVSHFEDMIAIEGTYVDPGNSDNSIDYLIILRPWGMKWEDVRNGDTSGTYYADMMPFAYDDWYLPLLNKGVTNLPESYADGEALLGDGQTQTLSGGKVGDFSVSLAGAEYFKDYEGKDAIRVYLDFTNGSDESVMPLNEIDVTLEQNGLTPVTTSPAFDGYVPEHSNGSLLLRPGCTIRIVQEFGVNKTGSTITVTVKDFWGDAEPVVFELDPSKLPGAPAKALELKAVMDPKWISDLKHEGSIGDYTLSIDSYDDAIDYEGNQLLRVYYTFTNQSDEDTSMWLAMSVYAYQDGVQLQTAVAADDEDKDDNYMVDIVPGESIVCSVCYAIRNNHPVEIEVNDFWYDTESFGTVVILDAVG